MKKFNKLFIVLIMTLMLTLINVKGVSNLSIEEASYDEATSVLTIKGNTTYGEVMVSAFKDDKPIAFKTTSESNGTYQTTIKVSFAEDTTIIVKVGDINSTEYKMLEVDVKKSLDPVPPQTISDNQGNSLTIVNELKHFEEHDELKLSINTDFDNLSEEEQQLFNFIKKQLGNDKKLAGSMELRVLRQGNDIELEETENGYLLFIKIPKEVIADYKNVYIAGLDPEFNVLEGHEFTYDEELGGLVGYVDSLGMFLIYEDSNVLYNFLDNTGNQIYNKDEDDSITYHINGAYAKYKNILIDEEVVDAKYLEIKNGSTIITISKDYLKKLKLGNHTVTVNYTDGSATTNLKVVENASTPTTLDNVMKYVIAGIIALAGLIIVVIMIRKKD